ncbi:BTAD domain-containing putative transcriptional regulator [Lichenicoccus sp.]|uniref:BTAD domain-containing putative transcriptional regulator n=1 Tax=Lichenicoccus sp. TaxID=2781899 RepID=UPI003D0D4748
MAALTLDNESVLPPGRKTRGLLAILALAGRRPVLRSKLAELLWSRRSEEQARASLRQEIHRLLEALTPVGTSLVSVERHSLSLRPALTSVDAERLLNANVNNVIAHASSAAGSGGGNGAGIRGSNGSGGGGIPGGGALPSLDGVLLEELNGTDPALDAWLDYERRRLHDHVLELYDAALKRHLDPSATVAICRQLLLLDPLHETAWQGLIQSQLQLVERGAALQSAERCMTLFGERAAAQPGPELSRLVNELRFGRAPSSGTAEIEPAALDGGEDPPGPVAGTEATGSLRGLDESGGILGRRLQERGIAILAVLPLLVLDPALDERLVQSLTDGIIVGLHDLPIITVISGTSLSQALAHGRDDALLRRSLGLDYVLDGTISRGRTGLRVILRLLDLRLNGHVVWARRYDCRDPATPAGTTRAPAISAALELPAALDMIDQVAAQVTAQLPWELLVIEGNRVGTRPATELNPNQLALRALCLIMRPERAQSDAAAELLRRLAGIDPEHPLAQFITALRHIFRAAQRWGDLASEAAAASAAIESAMSMGFGFPAVIATAGYIRSQMQDDPDAGLALVESTLTVNDQITLSLAFSAFILVRVGRLDEAAERFARYTRMHPLHPLHHMLDSVGITIAILQDRLDEAVRLGRQLVELTPTLLSPAIPCLAAYGLAGMASDAERLLARIELMCPGLSIDSVLEQQGFKRGSDAERFAAGLRAGGMRQSPGTPAATPGPIGGSTGGASGGLAGGVTPGVVASSTRPTSLTGSGVRLAT